MLKLVAMLNLALEQVFVFRIMVRLVMKMLSLTSAGLLMLKRILMLKLTSVFMMKLVLMSTLQLLLLLFFS